MPGYERIKEIAKQEGYLAEDLIALSGDNDPFYIGTPKQVAMAEWFAGVWEQKGFVGRGGVHLRRAHYQVLGDAKADGSPYQNSNNDWQYLLNASRYARYRGLVNPEDIIDRRNPQPHIYLNPPIFAEEPGFEVGEWRDLRLPSYGAASSAFLDSTWVPNPEPEIEIKGYDYYDFYQPYHVEVWAEKSTMNDVLRPACYSASANLVTGLGYMSITAVIALLRRIEETEKPTRILYVSDLDKAGQGMPVQVGRQCEFWLREYLPDADIRLEPIVLTPEQVETYSLSEMAIEDEETGEEKVELDALEGLHPGTLGRIVRENIARFQDAALAARYREALEEAQEDAEVALGEALGEHLEALEEIRREARPILERYEESVKPFAEEAQAELEPLRSRLEGVAQAIEESVTSLEVDLPEVPGPEVDEDSLEDEGWLFDSRRDYMEQLPYYKTPEELAKMAADRAARHIECGFCGAPVVAKKKGGKYCNSGCRVNAYRRDRSSKR